jgi:5-(carboxyamino)imidazole ribonucleotide mutase
MELVMEAKVLILMGSDCDLGVMKPALEVLKEFQVGFDARVLSVHRAPDLALDAASKAKESGYRVIICAAGMAAHLAGAVASKTTLPVIGVPIQSGALKGLDSLLSTVQMPPGVPVAAVAIDGGRNAGLLAIQILALADESLADSLARFKRKLTAEVLEKDKKLQAELS